MSRHSFFCMGALCFWLLSGSVSGQTPAHITVQPLDATVTVGGIARFSVVSTGQAPLTYLWLRNGVPIAASDGPEWVVPVASLAEQGFLYRCVVANGSGIDSSRNAVLHISAIMQAPNILAQPDSSPVPVGDTAAFKVSVRGTAPLTFAWFKNDVAIPLSNDSTLKVKSVAWADNGAIYRCHISNLAGTADSRSVKLKVIQPNGKMVVLTGDLQDLQGLPVGSGNQVEMDMIVRLFRNAKGGSAVYEERFLASEGHGVKVNEGRFNLALGRSASTGDLSQVAQANAGLQKGGHRQIRLGKWREVIRPELR
jgi:hypothetical protein